MISNANGACFWVITKFSGLEMKTMLKVYSIASVLMGAGFVVDDLFAVFDPAVISPCIS